MLITVSDITRKKRKFDTLRDKKSEVKKEYERLLREERKEKRRLMGTSLAAIGQAIKHTGFPLHEKVILLGAILLAKDALCSQERLQVIDDYINRYQTYVNELPAKQKAFLEEAFPFDAIESVSNSQPSSEDEPDVNIDTAPSNEELNESDTDELDHEGDVNAPES